VNEKFILSEILLVLNLLNVFRVYLRLGRRLDRVTRANIHRLCWIEAAVARLPLAALLIAVLHNGSVALPFGLEAYRILSNILIWIIFLVGGFVVAWFRDWYNRYKWTNDRIFGLALTYHTLSLAIEQMEIKVIPLQHIFAFVIAGVLACMSMLVFFPQTRVVVEEATADSQARVEGTLDETTRLLGERS
jgi:Fungal protein of unknown function (DUF1774)